MSAPRYFLFSVDTEPDCMAWNGFGNGPTLHNLNGISRLLRICRQYDVRPSFFLTFSVAISAQAQKLFIPQLKNSAIEVGTHFHPNDTPPECGEKDDSGDNIIKLNESLLKIKFKALHQRLQNLYSSPTSFRAGTWSVGSSLFSILHQYNYSVDSSITPGISWILRSRPDYRSFPSRAFFIKDINPDLCPHPELLEVPVSITKPHPLVKHAGKRLSSLFSMPMASKPTFTTKLIKTLRPSAPGWLRPAFTSFETMLINARKKDIDCDYLHMMCHSNELWTGASPYSPTKEKTEMIFDRITRFFEYIKKQKMEPLTLGAYARRHVRNKSTIHEQ